MQIDLGADSYDSFADPDFADTFLAADVARAALWTARDPDSKARGLVSATRMLTTMPWGVDPIPDPTALAADIPAAVQQATAMLAADLLAKPRLFSDASANSNVKVAKGGSAQVEFFRPVANSAPLPLAIWNVLKAAGLVSGPLDTDFNGSPEASGVLDTGCRPLGGRFPFDDWPITQLDYD